jgi:Mn-containing catalase
VKSSLSEAALEEADLYMSLNAGGNSHTQSLLYGGGPSLTNSSGVPWTAAYIDSKGDPTCDLRSNIAAESRAKIVYERLINITDDPGIKDALGFLMTREIAHQKSFEKALYSIKDNSLPANCQASSALQIFMSTRLRAKAMQRVPGTAGTSGTSSTTSKAICRSMAAMGRRASTCLKRTRKCPASCCSACSRTPPRNH